MAIVLSTGMLLPSAPASAETSSEGKTAVQSTGNDRSSGIRLEKGTYESGEVIIMFKDDVGGSLGDDFTIKDKLTFSDDLKTALVTSDKYSTRQMIDV